MERRYRVLRFIGSVYKILGIITAVLTVLAALGLCLTTFLGGALFDQARQQLGVVGPQLSKVAAGIFVSGLILIFGAVMTLLLYGAGEGLYLLIDLEENTRATALYLQQFSTEEYVSEQQEG